MKRLFNFLAFFLIYSTLLYGQTNPNHVYVKPHTKSDGTYVPGYYRTAQNRTNTDNFSTKGNVNPYTGQQGWIEPDKNKNYSTYPSTNNINSSNSHNTPTKYYGTINSSGQKVITYHNGKEVFGLCKSCTNVSFNETNDYYWYTPSSGIQKTKGGSSGVLLDGEYKFYNANNKLLIKENFNKGIENGDYISWDEDGNIIEKGHFTNGILDYSKFITEDGYIIEWEGEILKKGSVKKVYTNRGTLVEFLTVGDNFKFHYKLFYENGGQIESEFTKDFTNYYYDKYIAYYQNGNPKVIGKFTENIRDGIWKYFNEDSTIIQVNYRIFTEKHPNGKLKIKGGQYYSNIKEKWLREGRWIFFKENGTDWADVKYYESDLEVEK